MNNPHERTPERTASEPATHPFPASSAFDSRAESHPVIEGFTLVMSGPLPPFREGGFGRVYRALNRDGVLVAVKVPRAGAMDPEGLARWSHECAIARRLPPHEHVVTVFPAESARWPDGRVSEALVMEWLEGARGLIDYANDLRLDKPQRLALFQQALEGVAWMHTHDAPHCDLKSGNMLVIERRGHAVVKVTDFGGTRQPRRLDPRAPLFSPRRAAPEVLGADPAAINARADVYSLGRELAELIGGEAADRGREGAATWEPLSMAEAVGLPDRVLDRIIKTATASQMSHRYADAGEMGVALAAYRPPAGERRLRALGEWFWPQSAAGPRARFGRLSGALLLAGAACMFMAQSLCSAHVYFRGVPPLTAGSQAPASLDRVLVLRAKDQGELGRIAAARGVQGVDPSAPATYRRIWKAVLEELAKAQPRGIAIDILFPKNDDPALNRVIGDGVAAATTATPSPIPVTVVTDDFLPGRPDNRSEAALAHEVFDAGARWGCMSFVPIGVYGVSLAVVENDTGQARPGLAAVAVASMLGDPPGAETDLSEDKLLFRASGRGGMAIPLSAILRRASISGLDIEGTAPDDWVGLYPVVPPPDDVLRGVDVGVEEFLSMDPPARKRQVAGRLVFLSAFSAEDFHVVDERRMPGVWLHATAAEMLLEGIPGRIVSWWWLAPVGVMALVASLVAVIAATATLRRLGLALPTRRGAWRRARARDANTPPPRAVRRWRLALLAGVALLAFCLGGIWSLRFFVASIPYVTALVALGALLGALVGLSAALLTARIGLIRRAWCLIDP